MIDEAILATVLVTLLGGLFRGAAGFGGAMVMTLPLSLIYPAQQAIVMVLILELIGPALIFRKSWRAVSAEPGLSRLFMLACLACLLLLPLGIALQDFLSQRLVTLSMATTVVICSLALLLPVTRHLFISAGGVTLAGGLSGAMLGLTGIGGPPMVLYLLASQLEQRLVSSFLMLYVSLISLLMILASSAYFRISPVVILATLALFPVFFFGTMLSSRYIHRLNPRWVRTLSLLFLCLANGLFLILQIW
ncbi:MAG: TSUP family transporter [Burkholderiaceae bacterium]|jgi:uncharacterized membrane protein YfcA